MTHDPRCWFGFHAWQPAAWPPDLVARLRERGWSTQAASRFEVCPRCVTSRTIFAESVAAPLSYVVPGKA
ncbi:hypothetical protein [Methylobacterium nigriterrae]|uniref:hypothetical protein n=1 Tax=Methylobacterium nigriterrae TaxID=3127512 RepID=UPI003013E7F4